MLQTIRSMTATAILIFSSLSFAKAFTSEGMKIETENLFAGKDVIWSIEFLNPDLAIFTEKAGRIRLLDLKTKTTTEVSGAPQSSVWEQGGLMDLHIHPGYPQKNVIYISYTKKVGDAYTTAIAMGNLNVQDLKAAKISGLKDIFVAADGSTKGQHFGSRIVNDEKGFIYFSVGDRGDRDRAQNLGMDQGKIHRLTLDGETPRDNPFSADPKAKKTIWSYGHRNPQGLVYDFKTKTLWEQEHGPRGGDEINKVEKGKNYGWPAITFGREYYGPKIGDEKKEGMEQPVYHYTPSIATSGLDIYHGLAFPKWKGDLLSGALKFTHLNRLDLSDDLKPLKEERMIADLGERMRDVKVGPDGLVYVGTDSGKIIRLKPVL